MNSSNTPPIDSHGRIGAAIKRMMKQPSFVVAFVVLLLAAVSLNATTQFLQLHFKKLPVPLAQSLETIPTTVGSWVNVMKDQLSDDVQQELGTEKYIMRCYVDTSVVSKDDLLAFEGKDNVGRMVELGKLRDKYHRTIDSAIISFAVTYYTGKADTVAHIPERCYTADGYEPHRGRDGVTLLNCPFHALANEDRLGRDTIFAPDFAGGVAKFAASGSALG